MPTHTLLTPRLAATIVSRVAHGTPVETVAAQLGLGVRTLYEWQAAGRESQDATLLARRLSQGIAHARAHREWHILHRIERIAEADTHRDQLKALTWTLERHPAYRDRYGLKVQMQHQRSPQSDADQWAAQLSTEQLEAIVQGEYRELPQPIEPPAPSL